MAGKLQVELLCLGNGNALIVDATALLCKIEAARLPNKFGEFGQLVKNMPGEWILLEVGIMMGV